MAETQTPVPVVISVPLAEKLTESESFVIGGIRYTVEPDVAYNGNGTTWFFRPAAGFAGKRFIILAGDRRIVTRNLWMGLRTDEPDTASFEPGGGFDSSELAPVRPEFSCARFKIR